MTDITLSTVGRPRKIAFYIVVGLFCLMIVIFTSWLLPVLVTGWFNPSHFGIHQLHEMNNAALNVVVLAGMALQLHRPERKVGGMLMVLLLVGTIFIINMVAGTNPMQILPFVLFPLVAALLHPNRGEMLRPGGIGQPILLALVAVAAAPLLLYAVNQINLQVAAPAGDSHAEFNHYITMAGLAIAILLAGLLASFKITGWSIPAWGAGFLLLYLGLTSVVFPGQASSVGALWGALAIVGGLAFFAVTAYLRRRASIEAQS